MRKAWRPLEDSVSASFAAHPLAVSARLGGRGEKQRHRWRGGQDHAVRRNGAGVVQELKQGKTLKVCDAANTLRTWSYHQEYSVRGQTVEWNESENPSRWGAADSNACEASADAGGLSAGAIFRLSSCGCMLLPADEWLATAEEFEVSSKLRLPWPF